MFQQNSGASFGFHANLEDSASPTKKKSPFVPPLKMTSSFNLPHQRVTLSNFAQTYTQQNNERAPVMQKPTQFKQTDEGSMIAVHEDLGVDLRLNPELVMRKTAFNGSANAIARIYQEKHKRDQVLISINCSKASMPEKKTHQEEQMMFETKEQSGYGLDQIMQTKNSKTPNILSGKQQNLESQYHMSCRNGTSVLMTQSSEQYKGIHMPNIKHKKNSSIYNDSDEMMYTPLIRANGFRVQTNLNNGPRSCERPSAFKNKSSLLVSRSIIRAAPGIDGDSQVQSRTMAQFHNPNRRTSALTMYQRKNTNSKSPRQFQVTNDYRDQETKRVEVVIQDETNLTKRNEQLTSHKSQITQSVHTNKALNHHEHFSAQEIDLEELFPKADNQKKPAVMYSRAIKQLKTILCNKGLKDSGAVLQNTNYGLLHFHIEAGQNDISLNKFDANKTPVKRNSVQTRTMAAAPKQLLDVSQAYNGQSKFFPQEKNNKSDMNSGRLSVIHSDKVHTQNSKRSTYLLSVGKNMEESIINPTNFDEIPGGELQIPSHVQFTHLNEHVDNFDEIEAEDFVSNSLIKDSPVLKLMKKKPVEKFMMHLRETMNDVETFSQRSGQVKDMTDYGSFKAPTHHPHKIMRTILFIKETSDQDPDWVNMELKDFLKLKEEDLAKAYNKLAKVSMAVFSGAVNTMINKIDPKRVEDPSTLPSALQQAINILMKKEPIHKKNKKRWVELNAVESELFEELRSARDQLQQKKMMYGLWQVMGQQGSLPHSREGSSAAIIGNIFYLFGGFSRDVFGDFRSYDVYNGQWKIIPQQPQSPCARYSHTMLPYDRQLVVFGGAGGYVTTIKMRLSFNDVQIYDTDQEQWLKSPEIEGAPRKRMSHAASIMGGFMLVHGGYNTEQKKLLNDYGIFDLETQKWIMHKLYNVPEGSKILNRIDDKHFHYDEENSEVLGYRHMHTINGVYDQEYWNEHCNGRFRQKRVMWLKRKVYSHEENLKGLSFQEGFYLFGGVDQKGHTHNDLWLIQPHIEENELVLNGSTYDFLPHLKQSLSIKQTRITNYSGRPPCPRIMHSSSVFRDWNKHFILVINGGRNDQIFARTQNVALNDICLFNVNKSEWQTLAMYGDVPCSRWSHCFTMNRGEGSGSIDGFLVFGGVNLRNYCRSKIYQFQILNKWYQPPKAAIGKNAKIPEEDAGGYIDEKVQILAMQSKQKIELIKEIVRKQEE